MSNDKSFLENIGSSMNKIISGIIVAIVPIVLAALLGILGWGGIQIVSLSNDVTALNTKIENIEEKFDEMKNDLVSPSNDVTALNTKIESIKEKSDEMKNDLVSLSNDVTALNTKIESIKEKSDEMKNDLKDMKRRLDITEQRQKEPQRTQESTRDENESKEKVKKTNNNSSSSNNLNTNGENKPPVPKRSALVLLYLLKKGSLTKI